MGQQCGCFSDSAPRKLMHGTRVSAGKEKGHATALFIVHEIPGIGIGDCRVALRSRRLQYYERNTRIVLFGNSGRGARAVAGEIALTGYSNSGFFRGTYQELKRAKFFSERKPSPSNLDGPTR